MGLRQVASTVRQVEISLNTKVEQEVGALRELVNSRFDAVIDNIVDVSDRLKKIEATLECKMGTVETELARIDFAKTAIQPKMNSIFKTHTTTMKTAIEGKMDTIKAWTEEHSNEIETMMTNLADTMKEIQKTMDSHFENSVLTAVYKVEDQLESLGNLKVEMEKLLETYGDKFGYQVECLERLKNEGQARLDAGCELALILAEMKPIRHLYGLQWVKDHWFPIYRGSPLGSRTLVSGGSPVDPTVQWNLWVYSISLWRELLSGKALVQKWSVWTLSIFANNTRAREVEREGII